MRDDDDLVYILKAMKTTLKQNVTGINMRPGLKRSEAEDLLDYDMLLSWLCKYSFVRLFCHVSAAISYISSPRLTLYL